MKVGTTSSYLNPSSVKYLNEIVFGGSAAKNHELNKQITLDHYRINVEKKSNIKKGKTRFRKTRKHKTRHHPLAPR